MSSPPVRITIILILALSIIGNVVMYAKYRGGRPILSINGQVVTKKDMDDYLEQAAGPQVKAKMAERMLAEQAARADHVFPSDQEVEDAYNAEKERSYAFARTVAVNPWRAADIKEQIRFTLCQQRLRTKDVAVTNEEIQDAYKLHPEAFDTPNKAHAQLAVILDDSVTNDVKSLLEKGTGPTSIMQSYRGKVVFLGDNNVFTFVQPFQDSHKPPMNSEIFTMKPNEVKQMPATEMPADLARQGAKALIVRLTDIVPGHKADLNDPKTKEKLTTAVAIPRSKPWQEVMAKLWADAKIDTEDPNDKKYIEWQFFPDRAPAAGAH